MSECLDGKKISVPLSHPFSLYLPVRSLVFDEVASARDN